MLLKGFGTFECCLSSLCFELQNILHQYFLFSRRFLSTKEGLHMRTDTSGSLYKEFVLRCLRPCTESYRPIKTIISFMHLKMYFIHEEATSCLNRYGVDHCWQVHYLLRAVSYWHLQRGGAYLCCSSIHEGKVSLKIALTMSC